jgi:hypothetical protein
MSTLKNSIDDLATSATKLQAIHISELEFPSSSPNTDHLHAKLQALIPQLSDKASINLPSDAAYKENVARWSEYTATNPTAVVNVACEEDICAVVSLPPPFSFPKLTFKQHY